jgi:hypothetical protein
MSPHADPYEELAALFLTDEGVSGRNGGPGGGDGGATTRTADIELIVVGSLPVRATLWLVPYADALAREAGPTALVRLDDETATLQVLRAGADLTLKRWSSLGEAVAALSGRVARWVIRPALDITPGDLATAPSPRITILLSANEGAIVDAYRRVKWLVAAAQAAEVECPRVGLAVLGADRRQAADVQHQIAQTTKRFLGVEAPLVACVQHMDAEIRATECLTFGGEPKPALGTVLRWIRDATAAAAPEAPPVFENGTPPPASEVPEREPPASPAIRLGPKAGAGVEPKEPAFAREPDEAGIPVPLAAHIDGVTPVAVRCPGHERLELGIDQAGRLHVVAREEQLRELHVVEAWASAHRELIGQACPDHWIDPAAGTICHVFTDEPTRVADLHGSRLRLHVLAPVIVDGKQGWYTAPLNVVAPG